MGKLIILLSVFLSACNPVTDIRVVNEAVGNGDGVVIDIEAGETSCSYLVRKVPAEDCWGNPNLLFCNNSWLELQGCKSIRKIQ